MKKFIKKIVSGICVIAMLMTMAVLPAQADDNIKVLLNGQEIAFDVPPQIINGRTMVPMRAIFEALGYEVEWNGEKQSISAINQQTDIYVLLLIDNKYMIVCPYSEMLENDGSANYAAEHMQELDQTPTIIDGRTLVPVRAISEASGYDVQWDGNTRTVTIGGKTNQSFTISNNIVPVFKSFGEMYRIKPETYEAQADNKFRGYKYVYDMTSIPQFYIDGYINELRNMGFRYDDTYVYANDSLYVNDSGVMVFVGLFGNLLSIQVDIPVDLNLVMSGENYYSNTKFPTYDSVMGVDCLFTYDSNKQDANAQEGYVPGGKVYDHPFIQSEFNTYISYLKNNLGFYLYNATETDVTLRGDNETAITLRKINDSDGHERLLVLVSTPANNNTYAGTSVPTYESITGKQPIESDTASRGTLEYVYEYDKKDMEIYTNTLIDKGFSRQMLSLQTILFEKGNESVIVTLYGTTVDILIHISDK